MRSLEESYAYLHGYRAQEQSRLYRQAKKLESKVFLGVEFPNAKRILEVGSGVGAQTEILLERFPNTQITCVDASEAQIGRAKQHFSETHLKERVSWIVSDAKRLEFQKEAFEGAFLCWILEHIPDPLQVLKEVRRTLKRGSPIHCNEVFNQLAYVHPESEAIRLYWSRYNAKQQEMGGDPFIGAKLGYLLQEAGFSNIQTSFATEFWDIRDSKQRKGYSSYWCDLLMSASPELLKAGWVDEALVSKVQADMKRIETTPSGAIFFGWAKASAIA